MSEFLHMGGYATYVWSCFGLAAVVLTWNIISACRLHAAARERAIRHTSGGRGSQ